MDFCKGIGLMPEAVQKLKELCVTEEKYQKGKQIFRDHKEVFYAMILKRENYRMLFLYYFCRMACEVYEEYRREGIEEGVYWDTFRDLTFWCENCRKEFGEYGINQYDWFFRHIELTIFRLGRLEFERMPSQWNLEDAGHSIKKGDPVISVHIPQGEKLDLTESIRSCRRAFGFLGKDYPYICHSWLLYPQLADVLKPGSNILKFQELFQVVQIDYEEREAEWRIFERVRENPEEYPEKTSLQRAAKKYLKEGKRLGNGIGILKSDRIS